MDFFAQQARMRGSSRRLVVLFVLAIVAIVVAVDAAVFFAYGYRRHGMPGHSNASLMVGSSLAVLAVIVGGTLYRMWSLRGGGAIVAEQLGATEVPPDTADPGMRRLRNVIEEVAIAAGVPVPDIFVMENEPGINAFAAGYSPADAAVCVTRGALDALTRDELQGVIAHEFSHVINGDMRLNIKLMGLLFGILILTVIGQRVLWVSPMRSSRGRDNNNGMLVIGIALLVVGYIGYFFARLIQAAVARSRESLADASAVQFTRQTSGIAGALKKIAMAADGSKLQASNAQEVAHMLFGEAGRFNRLFATHPPLLDRIRELEPGFTEQDLQRDAVAAARKAAVAEHAAAAREPQARDLPPLPFAVPGVVIPGGPAVQAAILAGAAAGGAPSAPIDPGTLAAQVGTPGADDLQRAGELHRSIPDSLRVAVRNSQKAQDVLLAMALSSSPQRTQQLEIIARRLTRDIAVDVEAIAGDVAALDAALRLPLAALAFPALKRWPKTALQALIDTLGDIVRVDGLVDLGEYCLVKLVVVQLAEVIDPRSVSMPGSAKLASLRASYAFVCAVIARSGNDDDTAARHAWQAAMQEALPGDTSVWSAPPVDWQAPFDRALAELDTLAPASKELVVRGLACAVAADGVIRVEEAELLRVVCATMHCPLPPLSISA